jgi:hypothetical protein
MIFITFGLLIVLAQVCFPQTPACDYVPATASVRGLRLHQSFIDAKRAVPSLRAKRKASGEIEAEISFSPKAARPTALKDVQVLRANFIDGRLFSVVAAYKRSDLWSDAEEFVLDISRKMGLPDPAQWSLDKRGDRFLQCGSEVVLAGIDDGHPIVMLFDAKGADKTIARENAAAYARAEMQQALKEEKRSKFKP